MYLLTNPKFLGSRISSKRSQANSLYVFHIECLKIGETELTLEVGNKKSSQLPNPVVVSSKVKVVCGQPNMLVVKADVPQPKGASQPCPLRARTGRIAALAYEDVSLTVSVLDSNGRTFDNISSLDIQWSTSDAEIATPALESGVTYEEPTEGGNSWRETLGYRPVSDARQIVRTSKRVGNVDITAEMAKSSFMSLGKIRDTVQLSLVEDAAVHPEALSVFNHPDNVERAAVKGGSGYFEVVGSNQGVASSKFVAMNQSVEVRPTTDGDTVLHVLDLCLASANRPKISVTVTGVHNVELILTEKVQRGRTASAQAKLLDRNGQEIGPGALRFVEVSPLPERPLVKLTLKEGSEGGDLVYSVKGKAQVLLLIHTSWYLRIILHRS